MDLFAPPEQIEAVVYRLLKHFVSSAVTVLCLTVAALQQVPQEMAEEQPFLALPGVVEAHSS